MNNTKQEERSVRDQIIELLTTEFRPTLLEVIDESHKHIGHAGYKEGGETHFKVVMDSELLHDLTRVAQQQAVYKVLDELLKTRIHALSLKLNSRIK